MPTNIGEEKRNKELLCIMQRNPKNPQKIKKVKIKLVDVKNRCPGKNTDGTI